MTASAGDFEIKGWCPGALRPMQSGDGLIVRIRPFGAELSVAQIRGIADAAARHGNGHIDLTRRANLQIRGVSEAALGALQDALRSLGLLDARPEAEAVRNLLLSPLAGLDPSEALDMRPLARDLAAMLAEMPEAWALPAKFAVVLDSGGRLPLSGERADLRLLAFRARQGDVRIALGVERADVTEWLGETAPEHALDAIRWALSERLAEAHGIERQTCGGIRSSLSSLQAESISRAERPCREMPAIGLVAPAASLASPMGDLGESGKPAGSGPLSHREPLRRTTNVRLGERGQYPSMVCNPSPSPCRHGRGSDCEGDDAIPSDHAIARSVAGAVIGVGVPFGSLQAGQLRALADLVDDADGAGVRLSPWRIFYIAWPLGAVPEHLMAQARDIGFVTHAGDPRMRIQACPGRPACRAAHADARADALRAAAWMRASGFSGTAHLSGCAKGCARSAPADLMLTGIPGGYRLMRNASAQDEGGVFVPTADLAAHLDAAAQSAGAPHHG
jgi:precorrin-3B synthase